MERDASQKYFYSDPDDQITSAFIVSTARPDDWSRQEASGLDLVFHAARGRIPDRRITCLDFGTGSGRLAPRLVEFGPTVAYDPDLSRLAVAPDPDLEVRSTLPPLTRQFDLVVSSHVLQHVSVQEAQTQLRQIRQRITPEGTFALLTSRSPGSSTEYRHETIRDGKHATETIMQVRFDALTSGADGSGITTGLPVRFFAEHELSSLLRSAGFSVDLLWRFHSPTDDSRTASLSLDRINLLANSGLIDPAELDHRDVLVVASPSDCGT
jgi:SAM-dependent methyltransferase